MRQLVPTVYPIARVACGIAEQRAKRLAEGVNAETVARMEAADLRLARWVVACGEMGGVH